MENENLKPVQTIPPFTKMIMTIGVLPTSFYSSMSYYEAMVWLYEYLKNTIIPTVDNNGEAVIELQEKYLELKEWCETYVAETLPEEVSKKLDEMAEDGTLTNLITSYINEYAQLTFNNVADMKQASYITNGSFVKTYGYYEINDDGGALYKITDEESEIFYQEELENGLFATLITTNNVHPEIYGAYGDGIHDDTIPLQLAIDNNKNITLSKNYKITDTITIKDYENININAEKSTITYDGNNSAILIYHLNGGNIKFGTINASNGNGIELKSSNGTTDRIMYVKLSFVRLSCNEKNIYVNISGNGYINEIDIMGGQITSGDYGLYFNNTNDSYSGCNAWRIENIGFEGCDTCLYYNATNQGRYMGHEISNIRYIEHTTSRVLETHGSFYRCSLFSWGNLQESRLSLDYTNITDFNLIAPIYNEDLTSLIATGIYYNGVRKRYLNERTIKETLTGNANVLSGTITLFKINNLVIISLADVQVAYTSTIDIVDENNNPYPPNSYTGAFNSIIANSTADKFGRLLARTNGSIAVNVNDATATYNGQIVYYTDILSL